MFRSTVSFARILSSTTSSLAAPSGWLVVVIGDSVFCSSSAPEPSGASAYPVPVPLVSLSASTIPPSE
uniref:Putative secreted protein n=1 Tax=Anopheles darlingi TaxID=43151 RepID=A0A2M4DKC5_ANODA